MNSISRWLVAVSRQFFFRFSSLTLLPSRELFPTFHMNSSGRISKKTAAIAAVEKMMENGGNITAVLSRNKTGCKKRTASDDSQPSPSPSPPPPPSLPDTKRQKKINNNSISNINPFSMDSLLKLDDNARPLTDAEASSWKNGLIFKVPSQLPTPAASPVNHMIMPSNSSILQYAPSSQPPPPQYHSPRNHQEQLYPIQPHIDSNAPPPMRSAHVVYAPHPQRPYASYRPYITSSSSSSSAFSTTAAILSSSSSSSNRVHSSYNNNINNNTIITSSKNTILQCGHCGFVSVNDFEFKRHYLAEHSLQCSECNNNNNTLTKSASSSTSALDMNAQGKIDRPLRNKTFPTHLSLVNHLIKVHRWSRCKICSTLFKDEESKREHLKNSHYHKIIPQISIHPCKKCDQGKKVDSKMIKYLDQKFTYPPPPPSLLPLLCLIFF